MDAIHIREDVPLNGVSARARSALAQTQETTPRVVCAVADVFKRLGTAIAAGCRNLKLLVTVCLPWELAKRMEPGLATQAAKNVWAFGDRLSLIALPREERESTMTLIEGLVEYHHHTIMSALCGVPRDERQSLINFIRGLTECPDHPREAAGQIRQIINALKAIPREERELVIASVQRLFARGEGERVCGQLCGLTVCDVIQVIRTVPVGERELVITSVQSLFMMGTRQTGDLRLYGRAVCDMIPVIRTVPVGERESFIAYAQPLIKGLEIDVYAIPEVLVVIQKVPMDERDSIIFHAKQMVPKRSMRRLVLGKLIEVLHRIDADAREGIVEETIRRIALGMDRPAEGGEALPYRLFFIYRRAMLRYDLLITVARERGFALEGLDAHLAADGENVHAGSRDVCTRQALLSLRRFQGYISNARIQKAKDEFITYLQTLPETEDTQLALGALLEKKDRESEEAFGPLLDGETFSILGLSLTGEEVIGRLWFFASQLPEPEQTNAKTGMVSALKSSYDHGKRVCNQGKTQRLAIAVLQGRLDGVDIDGAKTLKELVTIFCAANAEITSLASLRTLADQFCRDSHIVDQDRLAFLQEVEAYHEVTF